MGFSFVIADQIENIRKYYTKFVWVLRFNTQYILATFILSALIGFSINLLISKDIIGMKQIFVWLLPLATCFHFHFSQHSGESSPQLTYTTFRALYPENNTGANSQLYLRGDNCNLTWTKGVPLKKTGVDTWSTAMLCPSDIKISVKLLINDTKWMMGANQVFVVTAGSQSPVLTIYPSFNPSINKVVDTAPFHSAILGNSRRLSLYYPPSYYDNKYKKYELLLLHDGQNLFDNSKAAFGVAWMVQNTVNLLVGEGKINETIIVGIWNTNDRINQYTYSYDPTEKQGGKGNAYLDFIQKQLLPKLKSQLFAGRIDDENGLGIGGSSLGGLISCYALLTRPQTYRKSICMSSSFWWNNEDFRALVSTTGTYNPTLNFYLDSGDSGPSQDNKASTDNAKSSLIKKGYIESQNLFYFLDKGGQHSESYWGKRFWIPMTDLYSAQ